jgi:hypothetical protein
VNKIRNETANPAGDNAPEPQAGGPALDSIENGPTQRAAPPTRGGNAVAMGSL